MSQTTDKPDAGFDEWWASVNGVYDCATHEARNIWQARQSEINFLKSQIEFLDEEIDRLKRQVEVLQEALERIFDSVYTQKFTAKEIRNVAHKALATADQIAKE